MENPIAATLSSSAFRGGSGATEHLGADPLWRHTQFGQHPERVDDHHGRPGEVEHWLLVPAGRAAEEGGHRCGWWARSNLGPVRSPCESPRPRVDLCEPVELGPG